MSNKLKPEQPENFTFRVDGSKEPIIVIDQNGFWYMGELIKDAGHVYNLFREFMEGATQRIKAQKKN